MTKNYKANPDRGNKMVRDRGLKGWSQGAAGPVKHITPPADPLPPSDNKFAVRYARYASDQRAIGRKPLLPTDWIESLKARESASMR